METLLPYGKAFLVGGLLCLIGQLLIDRTRLTPARILTGFGNALAKGVKKAVAEQGLTGAFTGGLTAASGGTAAAVFFGLLAALLFRPKDKNK